MSKLIKTIGIITSGGDAPGMNAAIRAVVRTAINHHLKVIAIHGGYDGLIKGDFTVLTASSVSNIIQCGGTIINTSRSEQFKKKKGRKKAFNQLEKAGIDAVVLIGGNGSFAGAAKFTSEFPMPFIGIPKTIDNDIYGTDTAIGFDTAVNTALQAIDKIRDTANSHHRLFLVEVMGRDLGFIALHCGIAAGAEAILVPEQQKNIAELIKKLETGWKREKSSLIVVVAEGAVKGGVTELATLLRKKFNNYEIRTSVLGYIQRGGNPSYFDRLLATQLGNEAIKTLLLGKLNMIVGMKNNQPALTPFSETSHKQHLLSADLLKLANELSS